MNLFIKNLKNNKNWPLIVILSIFALIFCSVSFVNHYNFRTYAWDLGIRNNAIWDYAHFRWNDGMLTIMKFDNILSDHFQLLPILVSPFYLLFGSYTMLLFQIIAILWGGIGIYVYINKLFNNRRIANIACIHFFSLWAIYSALGFDFHDNVVGAMFVPWFLYFVTYEKWAKASFTFVFMLISKENVALWTVFICIGLITIHYKDIRKLKYIISYTVIAFVYFVLVMKVIMPALANEGREYLHFEFSALGKDFGDAILTILTRPGFIFSLIFENHVSDPVAFGIKSELHFVVLLSGGVFLFFKPRYLIMLIPIYAQKLLNDDFGKWGINYQYSIEFVPVLTIVAFSWIHDLKNPKRRYLFAYLLITASILTTSSVLEKRISTWYNAINHQFYKKNHYVRNFDVKGMHEILDKIPDDAVVCAQTMLVPHLAFRDYIYQYPDVNNAEYIVLLTVDDNTYPLRREQYLKSIEEYRNKTDWEIFLENEYALVFKRKIIAQIE